VRVKGMGPLWVIAASAQYRFSFARLRAAGTPLGLGTCARGWGPVRGRGWGPVRRRDLEPYAPESLEIRD